MNFVSDRVRKSTQLIVGILSLFVQSSYGTVKVESASMGKRILCLHGSGSSGPDYERRMEPLIKKCREIGPCEWLFATAPHKLETTGFAWWKLPPGVRSYNASEFVGLDESLDAVRSVGPVDCVVGHSQGAMLGAIMLARQMREAAAAAAAPLRTKYVISGAAWPNPHGDEIASAAEQFFSSEERFCDGGGGGGGGAGARTRTRSSSLHLISSDDPINPPEMAERLAAELRGEIFTHTGKHSFPMGPDALKTIADYIMMETTIP